MHYAVNPQFKGHKKMHSDIYSVPQGIHLHKLSYHIIVLTMYMNVSNIWRKCVNKRYNITRIRKLLFYTMAAGRP